LRVRLDAEASARIELERLAVERERIALERARTAELQVRGSRLRGSVAIASLTLAVAGGVVLHATLFGPARHAATGVDARSATSSSQLPATLPAARAVETRSATGPSTQGASPTLGARDFDSRSMAAATISVTAPQPSAAEQPAAERPTAELLAPAVARASRAAAGASRGATAQTPRRNSTRNSPHNARSLQPDDGCNLDLDGDDPLGCL
jgi:hypothetical protein